MQAYFVLHFLCAWRFQVFHATHSRHRAPQLLHDAAELHTASFCNSQPLPCPGCSTASLLQPQVTQAANELDQHWVRTRCNRSVFVDSTARMHLIMGAVSLWTRPPPCTCVQGPKKSTPHPSGQDQQLELVHLQTVSTVWTATPVVEPRQACP